MQRRSFLKSGAVVSLAWSPLGRALAALAPDHPARRNPGIQLYTLRNELGKDAAGTLKLVAEAGYRQVEMYGFPNCQPQIDGAKAAGLALHSTHFDWACVTQPKDEAMSDFRRVVEKANDTGLKHLVIPYLQDGERRSLDDYRKIADHANRAGAIAKEAGIQLSYHNHAFELEPKDGGKCGYDIFIERFSKEVKFEIDVFWIQVGGKNPAKFIEALKGRVSQLHLKDLKKEIQTPNFGGLPGDAFKEVGSGQIDMKAVLEAGRKAGVEHYHVEQDQSPDAIESIRKSIGYLKGL